MAPWRRLAPRAAAALGLLAAVAWASPSLWTRLEADGVHDPKNPGLAQLQQPGDALAPLPRDTAGNQVRWVAAIESGAINPRTNLFPETVVRTLDTEIIIAKYGSMPAVKFPHRPHTLWLDCANCHDHLFKAQAGIFVTHIPYKGTALAIPDLITGNLDVMFDSLPTGLPHVRETSPFPRMLSRLSP